MSKTKKTPENEFGTWILEEREYGKQRHLTDSDSILKEQPKRLFAPLLPHQKAAVKAMYDLEMRRFVKLKPLSAITGYYASGQSVPIKDIESPVVETTAGVLSEKLGSGKSFEILALISINPIPRSVAEISTITFPKSVESSYVRGFPDKGFGLEVRRTYSKLLRQTVIFVGKSVLLQWANYITEWTDFKPLLIEDVRGLRKLHQMILGDKQKEKDALNLRYLNKFDIILVKNGIVSGEFDIPELKGTPLASQKAKPILTIFGEIFQEYRFARMILDDFDTIDIPTSAKSVPALFTWFVSSTKKSWMGVAKHVGKIRRDIKEIVTYYRPTYVNTCKNQDLFDYFNVCTDDNFIDSSTNVGTVDYYTYRFHNPNEQYISLLGTMGTTDASSVMEMLNGDAIETAAETAGITTGSVADIFGKILDKKWVKYKHNIEVSKYIPQVREVVAELDPLSDPENAITAAGLNKLTGNINKVGPLKEVRNIVKYNQSNVDSHIDERESINNEEKAETGKAIERVRDNLKEGDCPICCEDLADEEVQIMIMKCCGKTLCGDCVKDGAKMRNVGNNVQGTCPNCRTVIGFNQLIMIDKNMNLDDVINENLDGVAVKPEVKEENDEDEESEEEELNKFSCIIGIINGKTYKQHRKERANVRINAIMNGTRDLPQATPENRKVLVFANFKETLDNLEKKLNEAGISHVRLQGTAKQIQETTKRYKKPNTDPFSIKVLLINGSKYCAGLNLQNTTDLIFTHKVIDTAIESQIVGRAVRVGREHNLNVHYVLYDNEFTMLNNH